MEKTMPPLRLVTYPGPVLRKQAKSIKNVDGKLIEIAGEMFEVMYENSGIGLAAPQVGISQRMLVLDLRQDGFPDYIMINPRIIRSEGSVDAEEGCLSVPELFGEINRAELVEVAYIDRDGEEQILQAEGLLARAIQHEIDHLNGVLFIDRLERSQRKAIEQQLRELAEATRERKSNTDAG
jgi:peptide deformylase